MGIVSAQEPTVGRARSGSTAIALDRRALVAPVADIGSNQPDLDSSTERYARRFEGTVGEWLLSRQTAALRQLIAPWPAAQILDVGGGHGQIAAPLLADGHRVRVFASSEAALGRSRSLLHPRVETEVGSLAALPHPDRSFDVVTAFRVLAHIGDWQALLGEMCRVARHAVIFDFPIPGGVNALEPLLFGLKKWIEEDTRRYQTISGRKVRDCLAAQGFGETHAIGQFILPMVLHRTLGRPRVSDALERVLGATGLGAAIGTPVILRATRQETGDDAPP
jgi:ubiquinone/menaquinone biosynthesis C-methylase UbiE